jgi:tetratricopeptide (TPR) repeat protein
MTDDINGSRARLNRLLSYLDLDASNLSLLSDAAEAALACEDANLARALLDRRAAVEPLGPRELNLSGLAAMAAGDIEGAEQVFGELLKAYPGDAALRFNRAWALAMRKSTDEALGLLDDATAAALPQAAMLQVQLLHGSGKLEEALRLGRRHGERYPDHQGLMAALAVLAADFGDMAFARTCAEKATDHPDALTTLGLVALSNGRDQEARALFARALSNHEPPRALVGSGLVDMMAGDFAAAAQNLSRGAQLFETHVNSWIAAGWANILTGKLDEARRAFDQALSIDDTFAEAYGSLAVVAFLQGRADESTRLCEDALHGDPRSFAAAIARTLMLEARSDPDIARRIIERALNTPIEADGPTIARAIAMRALLA